VSNTEDFVTGKESKVLWSWIKLFISFLRNMINLSVFLLRGPFSTLLLRFVTPALQPLRRPFVARVTSWIVEQVLYRVCDDVRGLEVRVDADSSLALLRGEITGISITASYVRLLDVSISGDVGIYTDSIRFVPDNQSSASGQGIEGSGLTIAEPFAVSLVCKMTETDVNSSPPVVGVLKDLLVFLVRFGLSAGARKTIGGRYGKEDSFNTTDVELNHIELNQDGTLRVSAALVFDSSRNGTRLPLSIRLGLELEEGGRVIIVKQPELVTKGLFNSEVFVPFMPLAKSGADLGPDFHLSNLIIRKGVIEAEGIVVVRPPSTMRVEQEINALVGNADEDELEELRKYEQKQREASSMKLGSKLELVRMKVENEARLSRWASSERQRRRSERLQSVRRASKHVLSPLQAMNQNLSMRLKWNSSRRTSYLPRGSWNASSLLGFPFQSPSYIADLKDATWKGTVLLGNVTSSRRLIRAADGSSSSGFWLRDVGQSSTKMLNKILWGERQNISSSSSSSSSSSLESANASLSRRYGVEGRGSRGSNLTYGSNRSSGWRRDPVLTDVVPLYDHEYSPNPAGGERGAELRARSAADAGNKPRREGRRDGRPSKREILSQCFNASAILFLRLQNQSMQSAGAPTRKDDERMQEET